MTTQDEIRQWLKKAKQEGATHMLVVVDTYDHEDYPVFVKRGESVVEKDKEYNNKSMQRVMEVYALHLDIEQQLAEHRAFHFEEAPPPEDAA